MIERKGAVRERGNLRLRVFGKLCWCSSCSVRVKLDDEVRKERQDSDEAYATSGKGAGYSALLCHGILTSQSILSTG